jgi:hypothetical protein
MKIRVHLETDADPASLQLFDFYYAYLQSQNRASDYYIDLDIKIGRDLALESDAVNIGFYHMPEKPVATERYDIILIDNDHHHVEVSTQHAYDAWKNHDNCYLLSGGFFNSDFVGREKIISFPFLVMTRDYFTRPFYPQYFELNSQHTDPRKNIIYVNGKPQPDREYMLSLLESRVGDVIDIKPSAFDPTAIQFESFFESDQDRKFREFVNLNYRDATKRHSNTRNYYNHTVEVGIDQKFGAVPPGFFLIDQYWQYRCVVFPETAWLNNELFVTEKIYKCAVAKTVPWPIGGANIHPMYNEIGFKTAWNLLPPYLQAYTYELDHIRRYELCAEAIRWMGEHPEVLASDQAQDIVEHNHCFFFSTNLDIVSVQQLDEILKKHTPQRVIN